MKTAVRTFLSDLETRVDRLERRVEPTTDPEDALDQLLSLDERYGESGRGARRGQTGTFDLGYLSEPVRETLKEMPDDASDRFEAMTVSGIRPPSSFQFEWEKRAAFPTALWSFTVGKSDGKRVLEVVSKLLETNDPSRVDALRWYVETHLHRIVAAATESAVDTLGTLKQAHVATLERTDQPNTDVDPLSALDWTNPVAMLPVRLETRFEDPDGSNPRLLVRVFPDQLQVDTHEEALTAAEREWGTEFWTRLWFACHELPAPDALDDTEAWNVYGGAAPGNDAPPGPLPNDRLRGVAVDLYEQCRTGAFSSSMAPRFEEVRERAWKRGSERFGDERAAYVAHALAPNAGPSTFGERVLGDDTTPPWEESAAPDPLRFPTLDRRPASWTEPPTAELLPDRWVVYAAWEDQRDNYAGYRPTEWDHVTGTTYRRWDDENDRWVLKLTGPVVEEPLTVGPSPEAVAGRDGSSNGTDTGPADAPGMSWMVEFDAAKSAGMGLELALPTDGSFDPDVGFEEVVVTGVRTSAGAGQTADDLAALLESKEYTDGLSVLTEGTPTNNSPDGPAGDGPTTPAETAATKVGQSLVEPDTNVLRDEGAVPLEGSTFETTGDRIERALGIDPPGSERHPLGHVHDADSRAWEDAGHVNETLWPGTLGYYVKNMLLPGSWSYVVGAEGDYLDPRSKPGDEQGGENANENQDADRTQSHPLAEEQPAISILALIAAYRNHFRRHVRSEGPLGTLRVGDQPYGVLPVTPLNVESDATSTGGSALEPATKTGPNGTLRYLDPDGIGDGPFLADLIARVWQLRNVWLDAAADLPRVGPDGRLSDQAAMDLFSMEADGHTFRRQSWLVGQDNALWRAFDDEEQFDLASLERRPASARKRHREPPQRDRPLGMLDHSRADDLWFTGYSGLLASSDDILDDEVGEFLRTTRALLDDSLYRNVTNSFQLGRGREGWLWRLRALGGTWRDGGDPGKTWADMEWQSAVAASSTDALYMWRWLLAPGVTAPWDGAETVDPGWLATVQSVARQLHYFSTMREVVSSAFRLGALYGDTLAFGPEPAVYTSGDTVFRMLENPIEGSDASALTSHSALSGFSNPTYADAVRGAFRTDGPDIDPLAARYDESLGHVAGLDTDRHEDLLMGSLGTVSHRLDAWWTSVATRQLWRLREGQSTADRGVHVGAFGYVENLSAGSRETGEYLVAPSQNQVTSAAMMRSVHSNAADDPHKRTLAVDLSADRVETALSYLSAIRNGLPLSAVLGARFERRLHEAGHEIYLSTFRKLAPSRASTAGGGETGGSKDADPAEADVVDGLRLYRLWKADGIPWGGPAELKPSEQLPAADSTAASDIKAVFADFHRALDAVEDVLTAEGIHQLAIGNPERATAALEALSRGKRVPQLEFLETPRGADGITHRLFVLFGDASGSASFDLGNWAADDTTGDVLDPTTLPSLDGYSAPTYESAGQGRPGPNRAAVTSVRARDDAEPNLDGWVGELLPDPDRVSCPVEFQWTSERSFAVGSFATPTERGVVDVTDVGFEPDVVVFTVASGVGGATDDAPSEAPVHGWTHGKYRRRTDAPDVQNSVSLVAHSDADDAEYAAHGDAALSVAVPTADGTTGGTVTGTVETTHAEGFTVRFGPVPDSLDGRYRVQYRALRTGDESRVRVGHFTTRKDDANASGPHRVSLDDGGPAGTSGPNGPSPQSPNVGANGSLVRGRVGRDNLDSVPTGSIGAGRLGALDDLTEAFDPDYLELTATNAVTAQGASGDTASGAKQGPTVGFTHGTAVDRGGSVSQHAMATATAPGSGDRSAVAATDDGVLQFPAGDGSAGTRVRVASMSDDAGNGSLELAYGDAGDTGPGANAQGPSGTTVPRLVTYVAVESPPADGPNEPSHAPAVGAFTVPETDGDSVSVSVPFDPAAVRLTACPGATATPASGDPTVDVRTTHGSGGWSHGVATGEAAQQVLAGATRSGVGTGGKPADAAAGLGSNTAAVSLVTVDANGAPAGTVEGRVTGTGDGSFTVTFPSAAGSGSTQPVVLWTAWPTEPVERGFAAETAVTFADLDVGPLDALALANGTDRPGASQLERRLEYAAFRDRPYNRPPVPADATTELTFARPGREAPDAVSVAAALEAARSVRDVVDEGRPADAADFTHPSEDDGPGYLPPGSDDESGTADALRERGDAVHNLLRDAKAVVENRVALLDPADDEPTLPEKVDRVDRAVRAFGEAVPARQVAVTATEANDWYEPALGRSLLDELERVAAALRAGPSDPGTVEETLTVETGRQGAGAQTVRFGTGIDAGTDVAVTVAPLADAARFQPVTESTRVQSDGDVSVTVDARQFPPGTRFAVSVVADDDYPPLDAFLTDRLNGLDADELADLARWVAESVFDERWQDGFTFETGWSGSAGLGDRSGLPGLSGSGESGGGDSGESGPGQGGSGAGGSGATDRWPERDEWRALGPEERLDRFRSLPREAKIEVLARVGATDAAEHYGGNAPTGLLAYRTGRVVEAAGSDFGDRLDEVLAGTELVGPLLWLDRVHDLLDPSADTTGRDLDRAIDPTTVDHTRVATERRLLRTVASATSDVAFSEADYETVTQLEDLLGLDLPDLAAAMRDAVGPLEQVGLRALVSLTGDPARPAAQTYWRVSDPQIGQPEGASAAVAGDSEATVRARIRNFVRAPVRTDVAGTERYAPELRRLVASSPFERADALALDGVLAEPAAFVAAAAPVLDRPDELVRSIHELLYHPSAFAARTEPGTFLSRYRTLSRALSDGEVRARFESVGSVDPERLAAVGAGASGQAFRQYVRDVGSGSDGSWRATVASRFQSDFDNRLDALESQAETGIEQRFAPAYATGDLATPFRTGVLETLRRGLLRASYLGVYGSTPESAAGGSGADAAALLDQADAVLAELEERDAAASGLAAGDTVEEQVERIDTLLDGSVTVLPPFAPTNAGELSSALAASDALVGDRYDVDTWLLRNGRLRDRPRHFREVRSYADHFGVTAAGAGQSDATSALTGSLTVGQLPLRDPTSTEWVGSDGVTPRGDELSLVGDVATVAGTTSNGDPVPVSGTPGSPPVAGLFVDGWAEQVPEDDRTLGVGVEYDEPDVRPPQSVLLAVPPAWKRDDSADSPLDSGPNWEPTGPQSWSMEALRTTIDETGDLIETRGVDLDAVGDLGHLIPALTLPYNETTTERNEDYDNLVYLPDAPSVDLGAFPWHLLEGDE